MMAKTHILVLFTWTFLQSVGVCNTAEACVCRCENGKNVESLEKKLTELQADLGNLKRDVGPKVGFSASLGGLHGHVVVGPAGPQTIAFQNVFINNGNAYNPATGVFTAPLNGAFQFTFTTYGHSPHYSGARLMKNGQQQVTTWQAKGKVWSDSTSGTAILSLKAGDKVNVVTWGNNFQVFDNVNHHTTFNGFLLFPL